MARPRKKPEYNSNKILQQVMDAINEATRGYDTYFLFGSFIPNKR